jgi:hypothetical protein
MFNDTTISNDKILKQIVISCPGINNLYLGTNTHKDEEFKISQKPLQDLFKSTVLTKVDFGRVPFTEETMMCFAQSAGTLVK